MEHENRGFMGRIVDGFASSFIILVWLGLIGAGLYFSWPWLKSEYIRRFPERPAPMVMDSGAYTIGVMSERVASLREVVESQAQRISALEARERVESGEGFAYITSLLMLERRVAAGAPFMVELSSAMRLATPSERELLAKLEPFAADGVAAARVLEQELFERAAEIIFRAENELEDANLLDRTWFWVRGLVRVRRIDGAAPDSPSAAANSALLALARGDVVAAAEVMAVVADFSADFGRRLTDSARARSIIEDAISRSAL